MCLCMLCTFVFVLGMLVYGCVCLRFIVFACVCLRMFAYAVYFADG